MNLLQQVSLLVYLSGLVLISDQQQQQHLMSFDTYRRKFGKAYSNVDELRKRSEIFWRNARKIQETNQYAEAHNLSFRMEVNPQADLDDSEFFRTYGGGYRPWSGISQRLLFNQTESQREITRIGRLMSPRSKNWVSLGKVTAVKNQGPCNSCWAFAIVAVIESFYSIRGHRLTPFSEQQLVDCSVTDGGCVGGNHYAASLYIMENGIMRANDYPYVAEQSMCRFSPRRAYVARPRYGFIMKDESFMETVVGTQGPIAVAIFAGNNFRFYSRGILYDPHCLDPNKNRPNHTVALVGFDTDHKGRKYWLGKNSWGTGWGMGGYFRMPRGINYCGITYESIYVAF